MSVVTTSTMTREEIARLREQSHEEGRRAAEAANKKDGAEGRWAKVNEVLALVFETRADREKKRKLATIELDKEETATLMSLQSGTAEDAVRYMDDRREDIADFLKQGNKVRATREQDKLVLGLVLLANSTNPYDQARYNDIMVIEIDTAAEMMLQSTGHYPEGYEKDAK